MATHRALIVDDEPDIRELLELTLGRMDIDTRSAANLADARSLLEEDSFDICLTDMRLPDGDGIDLVRHIQQHSPELPVAVITAYGSMESAVEALKAGAFDFVSKPVNLNVLRNLVNSVLMLTDDSSQRERRSRNTLLGESEAMREIRSTVEKLSRSQAPIYIWGESGTGKELVARLIHDKGPRADRPFVPVNCGAIPAELMESEFFGHKKGSFTGAVPTDVRILSATHRELGELVEAGEFRQDLYYRLNVIQLEVPPLRERREDIRMLASHCLDKLAQQNSRPGLELNDDAMEALGDYDFPGNVRELENILERATTLCEGSTVTHDDLNLPTPGKASDTAAALTPGEVPLDTYMDNIEKDALIKALKQTRYNKTAAAKQLGITFRALRYRLKKLGLE